LLYTGKVPLDSAAFEAFLLLVAHHVQVNAVTDTRDDDDVEDNDGDVRANTRTTLLDGTPAARGKKRTRDADADADDDDSDDEGRAADDVRESDADFALTSVTADVNGRVAARARMRQLLSVFFAASRKNALIVSVS
jgi:hypothetical protein